MKAGILGCGIISHTYLRDLQRLYREEVQVVFCANRHPEKAQALAAEFSVPKWGTPEQLLADPEVELVLNLTAPKVHTEMNRAVLRAGKHLFCEKPFALSCADAQETVALAEQRGLKIGTAPDTFLAAPLATCRAVLREGRIGRPLYGTANMMSFGVENWHASPAAFYLPGGGPLMDMGPYYLTAIVTTLGPIESITGCAGTGFSVRRPVQGPAAGQEFPVETPTFYTAVLRLRSGVLFSVNFSFDIWKSNLPKLEIYGTEGTLELPDPNMTDGQVRIFRREQALAGETASAPVPNRFPSPGEYTRGAGVADLARAVAENRAPKTGPELALHVTEALLGMQKACTTGETYHMETTCRPAD